MTCLTFSRIEITHSSVVVSLLKLLKTNWCEAFVLRYANENVGKQWDPCIIRITNLNVNFKEKSAHYTWVNTV